MADGPKFEGMVDIEESIGLIDIDVESNLHDKADSIKSDTTQILQDTADMQPKLGTPANGTISQDIADVKAEVDHIVTTTDDTNSVVNNATYGNEALKNEIDQNEVKIDQVNTTLGTPADGTVSQDIANVSTQISDLTTTVGTPANGTVSQDIADIKAVVDSLNEGQGSFIIAVDRKLEVPDTGDKWYPFQIINKHSGQPASLDSLPTVHLENGDGTSFDSLFYDSDKTTQTTTPSENDTGIYKGFIKLPYDQPLEPLTFSVSGVYSGDPRYQTVMVEVQEYSEDSFLTSDRTTLDSIYDDTDDMQPRVVDIQTKATDTNNTVHTIDSKVDIIDNNVDSIVADIDLIKNKDTNGTFDRSTDSLEAISEMVYEILTKPSGPVAIEATKTSGAIAVGGSEVVALTESDGISSSRMMLYQIKVKMISGDATKFKVKGYRDSSQNYIFYDHVRDIRTSNGLNTMVTIVFINKDVPESKNVYIQIDVTDGGSNSSTFEVSVLGHSLS